MPQIRNHYMKHLRKLSLFFPLVMVFLALLSCRKFEGDQTIPAYIKIDFLTLETDYSVEGTSSAKIETVWIYVDGNLEGIYELPVMAPILARDMKEVIIQAGINLNGIASTRAPYPFYESVIQDVRFLENKVVNINGGYVVTGDDSTKLKSKTRYQDNCVFVWMEDFEDPSVGLDSLPPSQVDIQRTKPANYPEAYLSSNSSYSGYIELTEDKPYFRIATNVGNEDGFELPQANNWPIFLELNYKCNQAFTIGVFANEISQIIENPLIGINPSEEWNKIYINLKPIVNYSVNAIDFNIVMDGYLGEGLTKGEIYLDNIKLIYRSGQ
ncbi:MAG: hypothetical protein U9R60_08815 [Bacteroidota bacterium]|nr:hypothetical protein [Bacteroidota bacterium]